MVKSKSCWVIRTKGKNWKYLQFVGGGIAHYKRKSDALFDLKSYKPVTMNEYKIIKTKCRLK